MNPTAFCTNCGTGLADDAHFCPNCGLPLNVGFAPGTAPVPPLVPKLDYDIQGNKLQKVCSHLKAGQEVYAEAGRMIYKTPNVLWDTRMSGSTIGEKIWGAVKRKLMGESRLRTYFHALTDGEVGFAGTYPGKIQVFELAAAQTVLVQRDSFLFAQSSAQLNLALVRKLRAGFFGGEGFILEKLTGPGAVFIHAGGDFVEFTLKPGEVLQVDSGCIVAFDESVSH